MASSILKSTLTNACHRLRATMMFDYDLADEDFEGFRNSGEKSADYETSENYTDEFTMIISDENLALSKFTMLMKQLCTSAMSLEKP